MQLLLECIEEWAIECSYAWSICLILHWLSNIIWNETTQEYINQYDWGMYYKRRISWSSIKSAHETDWEIGHSTSSLGSVYEECCSDWSGEQMGNSEWNNLINQVTKARLRRSESENVIHSILLSKYQYLWIETDFWSDFQFMGSIGMSIQQSVRKRSSL